MRRLPMNRLLLAVVAFALLASASAFGAATLDLTAASAGHQHGHRKARKRHADPSHRKRGKRHGKQPKRHRRRKKHHSKRHHKVTKIFTTTPTQPIVAAAPAAALAPSIGATLPTTSPPAESVGSPEPPGPVPTPPHNIALPSISGTPTEGDTLTASNGNWEGSPTSYIYQWQDCTGASCTKISGATTSTHKLTTSDVGHTLTVIVTATNAGGSTPATSPATAKVAAKPARPAALKNTALPAIEGTAIEGDTLAATDGNWEGSPTSYIYQWQDCISRTTGCTAIGGATASTYDLTADDVGLVIRVVVTATNEGESTSATSRATAEVTAATSPPPPPPTNTALPSISGTPIEGDTLTASNGNWEGSPTSYAYQWQDCNSQGEACTKISGAMTSTHRLTASDAGHTITVLVTATNEGGSTSVTSPTTAVVTSKTPPAAPKNTALPAISGTPTEGDTLKATAGTWEGSPTSYAYQWQDCTGASCTKISGATTSTHKLTTSDVGHTLTVIVTATNAGGSTPATSPATATVAEAASPPLSPPTNTALPAISGTPTEGETLTATAGTWEGSPTSYAYQWQDCTGASCTKISGATTSTHKLTTSDVGHTLTVIVTATNEGGSTPATSTPTATIAKAVTDVGCTTTIGSGLQAAIEKASAGSTICLEAGNYGEIGVSTSKSGMVTIEPASGVSQSQAVLGFTNVKTSSDLTFEGLTIAGGNNGSESSPATHIHWIGDAFTSGLCIQTPTSANIDVLVESSTFVDIDTPGCGNEGRLQVNGDNKNVSGTNGVVISHDLFETASPRGCTDGVNITGGASGTVIGPGDEFSGMEQGSCDPEHVDPIQFYGGPDTTVTGDYFHGNSDGIMSPDGNGSPMTVTNNVFDTDGEYPNQIVIGGGGGDVIEHNTFGNGAGIRIGSVNVGPTADDETIRNNIITGELDLTEGQSSSGWSIEYNLVEGATIGSHGIDGRPAYVGGGSEPSTWAGWELTSTSPGHDAASNGTNIGANYFGS